MVGVALCDGAEETVVVLQVRVLVCSAVDLLQSGFTCREAGGGGEGVKV